MLHHCLDYCFALLRMSLESHDGRDARRQDITLITWIQSYSMQVMYKLVQYIYLKNNSLTYDR